MGYHDDENKGNAKTTINDVRDHRSNRDRAARPEREERRTRSDDRDNDYTGFASFNDLNGSLFDNNNQQVNVDKIIEVGDKIIKETPQLRDKGTKTWGFARAGTNVTGMSLPTVVVYCRHQPVGGVAYTVTQPLVLMGNKRLERQRAILQDSRDPVEYSAVPADVMTDEYREAIQDFIAGTIENAGDVIVPVTVQTLPATFEFSDGRVRQVLQSTMNLLWFTMNNKESKLARINLGKSDLKKEGKMLESIVTYNSGEQADLMGLPKRQDLVIETSLVTKRSRDRRDDAVQNVLSRKTNDQLATINGYVDYVWVGSEQQVRRRRSSSRRDRRAEYDINQVYGLALHITKLSTEDRPIPELEILALASVAQVMDENVLIRAAKPTPGGLRDPRAMGYELPEELEEEIPEKISDADWMDLNDEVVRPDRAFIFIHIPKGQQLTPFTSLLLQACSGEKGASAAEDMLVKIADRLTDGEFTSADIDGGSLRWGVVEDAAILDGYWDHDGKKMDLTLAQDYFSMLSRYGKDHPEYVKLLSECMIASRYPLDVRLAKQEELVKAFTGNSAVITDRSTVIRLNPEVVFAIADAIKAAGVTINSDGVVEQDRRRSSYNDEFSTSGYDGRLFERQSRGGFGRNSW